MTESPSVPGDGLMVDLPLLGNALAMLAITQYIEGWDLSRDAWHHVPIEITASWGASRASGYRLA
eukprot:6207573-Karenia_brevis.AAC.1